MALFSFLILTSLCIVGREALTPAECGAYARRPAYTDISVVCGTSSIDLAIQICPAVYTGYNESLLILNYVTTMDCQGWLDTSVVPPVLRFSFPIKEGVACGSNFKTTSNPGTGIFSDFSNIQTVNVSGVVRSFDPTIGTVTYNAELKYFYSCAYPLEYLVNNTQVDVSASTIALRDLNGSFISTLSMSLYKDANYTQRLIMPPLGIELRTNIYVQVVATNLTSELFVLLDQCYASVSAQPSNSSFKLFVPCSADPRTTILENGNSHKARFYFPAFRFMEQQNQTVSTYYLHCITRLCDRSTCGIFKQCFGKRRRRAVDVNLGQQGITESSLLTVPIVTKAESPAITAKEQGPFGSSVGKGTSVGLEVAVGVLVVIVVVAILTAGTFYRKLKQLR